MRSSRQNGYCQKIDFERTSDVMMGLIVRIVSAILLLSCVSAIRGLNCVPHGVLSA